MPRTPMMEQYFAFKEQYPGHILFFRLGDFYEMFYDDAKLVSRELELTLTGKDCGEEERAPMCGVPYHAAENYLARLVSRGYKVAVCEQMEDPALAKGLVKRDIVRIVTPGTVAEGQLLTEKENNYLASVCVGETGAALCFADVSTGDLSATLAEGDFSSRIINEIGIYTPKELLINSPLSADRQLQEYLSLRPECLITEVPDLFDEEKAAALVAKYVSPPPEDGSPLLTRAIGALLAYLEETQRTELRFGKKLELYRSDQYLSIDANTRRSLEITETMRGREKRGSLIWVLDRTKTSAGARLLRKWLEFPLVDCNRIASRQRLVGAFYDDFMLREEIGGLLKGVLDLERLMTKVNYGTSSAKDLRGIANTLALLPKIRLLLTSSQNDELFALGEKIDTLEDVCEMIDLAIVDDPPFLLREGGIIRAGYSEEVDRLNAILTGGEDFKSELEAKERAATGIKNLKIGYNRVFGYYIEVSKSNLSEVPDTYIRKQTLVNGERFITKELKELESTILGAKEKVCSLEYDLFQKLRQSVSDQAPRIQKSADALSLVDVYLSLADVASRYGYVCPEVDYGDEISVKEGRHPVVERFVKDGGFVPNDTLLDAGHNRLMIITGPNMAGKSTYMRQVALIALMAQIGSFVPAKEARIGLLDKIFTRVGASDDLASGQSTFMLEMNEVAFILKNATRRSLILYDEIGRGTSTFDGMSIARAVAEYTLSPKIGAKTLFATHYHELTALEEQNEGAVNYNIAAKKKGDDVIFLRKIVRGKADDSYGIEVAGLAGVPRPVIRRAKEVLAALIAEAEAASPRQKVEKPQVSLDDFREKDVLEKIRNTDPDLLTPMEALELLHKLKKTLD